MLTKKITNEEAIEWFRGSPAYHADHEPYNMAIEALKQTKWTPVSERLPDMGKYVLCSVDKNHVYESDLEVVIVQFRNEDWWTDGRIKAWMPLPEPYKAESED